MITLSIFLMVCMTPSFTQQSEQFDYQLCELSLTKELRNFLGISESANLEFSATEAMCHYIDQKHSQGSSQFGVTFAPDGTPIPSFQQSQDSGSNYDHMCMRKDKQLTMFWFSLKWRSGVLR